MPDGSRIELRQVSANLYQSADSSYLVLDGSTMILRTTEGTQLSYAWKGYDYQCTSIKDRNGNFITIEYTPFGLIDKVVDTLSRQIKFNYENNYLTLLQSRRHGLLMERRIRTRGLRFLTILLCRSKQTSQTWRNFVRDGVYRVAQPEDFRLP